MRRRRSALLGGLALLLVAVTVHAQSSPTDVAKVAQVMWWSKRPGAQPTTGASSLEVASGVDGNESVAAIRVLIYGSVTKATLTLAEAANQTTAISVPKLQVCPTDTPWVLSQTPGTFDQAPTPNCATKVPLTRDDKANWTADITGMMGSARSEVSVMVVPAEDKTLPVPPTFFLQVATSRVLAEGTLDVAPPPPPPANTATAAPVTHTNAPVVASPVAPVNNITAPTTTPTTEPTVSPTPIRLGGAPAPPKRHNDWGKLVWILPLTALIAVSWTMSRKMLAERGLVPVSD